MATSIRKPRTAPAPVLPVTQDVSAQAPGVGAAAAQPAGTSPLVQAQMKAQAQAQEREAEPPGEKPAYRALRVYAFDPSRGRRLGNYMTVRVKYEPLRDGLAGDQVEVIDFDATNDKFYKAVQLNSQKLLVEGGLEPSESDPRFHQQMVYAVAMETIKIFENALGRDIRFDFGDAAGPRSVLRIFPHAMYEPNAFYSRELGALLFGYFRASDEDAGSGLPGGTVFTCLSHDIIAHETTHAIVDTLRSRFMEPSNPDVFAFHEAFADIVALFQHFRFENVVRDTLQRTGGILHRFELDSRAGTSRKEKSFIIGEMPEGNPLLDLARQFGESMGRRAALRSALGFAPDPGALASATEPHERGAVLVAAVFDAFFSSFMNRTADLIRTARAAAGGSDEIHPDIAARLAKEAAKTAMSFSNMCIRALDYCPPVDITFGEFLRALVTADTELYQSDDHEYREALIQAFRARGIYPDGVASLAEESLLWDRPEGDTPECPALRYDLVKPNDLAEANRQHVEDVVRANPYCFGLCSDPKHTRSAECTCKIVGPPRLVNSVNMVIRGGGGRPKVEFVAEIIRSEPLDPERPDGERFSGGATVVFDSCGKPKLIVYKKMSSESRRKSQLQFRAAKLALSPFINYVDEIDAKVRTGLAAIHGGY